ncbi:hypothetical protein V3C99_013696 [Haemonchus contortus]|uniref:Uncharacterized protein n=1 Tax=Haemonchus contortus TaxID=6289 RepID=A0A7I4Y1W3_HAECO|nr:unnamed protein product [Haemonchus contortus]
MLFRKNSKSAKQCMLSYGKRHSSSGKKVSPDVDKVNCEVGLNGRIAMKHANQLRRHDTKSPSSYGDKSLLTLFEKLELDDVWKRREETTQATDVAALGRREHEVEVPPRRLKRIKRPVQRYPDTSCLLACGVVNCIPS